MGRHQPVAVNPVYTASPPFRSGSGALVFQQQGNRTILETALARSPLRFLTPRNHGHGSWVFLSSFGGGMVDGDRFDLSIDVEKNACAFLSTQGPTRVFRSPSGCHNSLQARVQSGALFAATPDPISLFAHARLTQRTAIELDEDGSLVWMEALTSGRPAHGERWAFSRYDATLNIRAAGKSVVNERLVLDAMHGQIAERMRRFDALGTLVLLGPRVADWSQCAVEEIGREKLTRKPSLLASASGLPGGAILRFAATSVETLTTRMRHELRFLSGLLGDHPLTRRL